MALLTGFPQSLDRFARGVGWRAGLCLVAASLAGSWRAELALLLLVCATASYVVGFAGFIAAGDRYDEASYRRDTVACSQHVQACVSYAKVVGMSMATAYVGAWNLA